MAVSFSKYQATGNDFILLDNRSRKMDLLPNQVALMCDRHFGIGADGLIALEEKDGDWHMAYFNSDGHRGSFCGNGSRCFALFLVHHGLADTGDWLRYTAYDGWHRTRVLSEDVIETEMHVAAFPRRLEGHDLSGEAWFVHTGSPHVVILWPENPFYLENLEFEKKARGIRESPAFQPEGTNVNFVHRVNGQWTVRTFERGVEAETLSCGTGVVAAALVARHYQVTDTFFMRTAGGELQVHLTSEATPILRGPARKVFEGFW
ncbi:MAG: diaminopimelate epimerase [Flavobacteriales bacterium]|nr:diaminopimelate epimerase [Flavobacteriales bacterium]MDW8432650.1 diaminopimelate epimerase [Flavobacteriales bacterium]